MRTYGTDFKGERIPIYKLLVGIEGNLLCYVYSEKKISFPQPNELKINTSGMQSINGMSISKTTLTKLADTISYIGSFGICTLEKVPTNEDLFWEFDNVPLINPHMNITWPVWKETNRLKVQATGSGWWLYYKNDSGEYEKAKKPNGESWHLSSRIKGLDVMYRINNWTPPTSGFK